MATSKHSRPGEAATDWVGDTRRYANNHRVAPGYHSGSKANATLTADSGGYQFLLDLTLLWFSRATILVMITIRSFTSLLQSSGCCGYFLSPLRRLEHYPAVRSEVDSSAGQLTDLSPHVQIYR